MWVRNVILTAKQVKNRGIVLPVRNNITKVIINSSTQSKQENRFLSNFKADADQKKVIEHMNPQAFVIAGPGTGKTHCAIGRVQHLIESNIAEPEEILVLTTADKTAANIQYQIDLQTPLSKNTSTIRSWITMSYSFLQEFKDRYRTPVSEVKAASFMERGIFFQEHFKDLGFNLFNPEKNPLYHTNAILNYFTRLQEANVTPEKYHQYIANLTAKQNEAQNLTQSNDKQKTPLSVLIERHTELAAAYAKFISLKWDEKKFDHLDVMMAAMKMFEERPDFVEEIRNTFPHVIVDEVQDINPITLEFIKLLGNTDTKNRTMTLFGDDDLAIFRWRGAIPNVFDRLADHFPNAAIFTLANNYRSPAPILTAARNLITKNGDRMEVKRGLNKLMTANVPDVDGSARVEHFVYDTRHQEVTAVVQMVQTILKNEFGDKSNPAADIEAMMQKETNVDSEDGEKREPKIVLAVRSKNEMLELSNALREAGVSFVNKTFNQKINMFPEVQFLLNFLIALVEPSNAHVLYQLLGSKMYSFPSRALAEVTEDHVQNRKTLRQALKDFSDRPIASIKDADMVGYISKARRIIEDLEYYEKAMTNKTTMQIIYEFLKKNKLLKSLRAPTTQLEEQQGKNIAKFLKLVGNVERKLKTSLPAFVIPYLKRIETLWSELVEEEEISPVALTTLWNLRNNEYDYVIFSGATNDSTPGRLKQSDLTPPPELTGISIETAKEYQEEERRLVYMLLTRAKKKFIFTNYTVRDNKNKAAVKFSSHNPSKFIAEALGQPKVSSKKKAVEVAPEPAEPTTTAKDFFKKTGPITLTPKIDTPPTSLDFDQIRIFDRCPLHYYYQYVLKMPIQPTFLMAYQTAFKNTLTALFENERSFEASDESGEPKRTFNFLELMHKFNDDLKTLGFPNIVEVDPKKYSSAMAALEEYFDKDYEGFKGINQPFSIKIDLKAPLDQLKNLKDSNNDQSFTITGNFHRVFEDNEVHHFYTYTEGYIPEEQVKFVQSVLALAYYQTYNLLPRKITTEFVNHNFYTIKKLKLSPDMSTIEETYKLLQSLANNVRQSVFQAQPSFSKCLFCNFNHSCPSAMLKNKRK